MPQISQGTACCVWVFAVVTLCLFLALGQRIGWVMADDDSYWVAAWCCGWWGYCVSCPYLANGEHIYTRPIAEDELPQPMPLPNNASQFTEAGDGENDYWSAIVAMSVGSVGSILLIIATCGPLTKRGTAPTTTGFCVLVCFFLHLATTICLGIQFFTDEDDEWVYNKFISSGNPNDPYSQYEQFSGTLAHYLSSDRYLYTFGNTVYAAFFFVVFLLPIELIYGLVILTAPPDKSWIHGISEFSYTPTFEPKYATNTAEQRA